MAAGSNYPESLMDTPKNELRQRLRELLTVHERERTDAQWDEIIELEIRLAPGNQIDPNRNNNDPVGAPGQNYRQPRPQNKGGSGHPNQQRKQQGRRPNKGNPQRGPGNTGGGGNPGGGNGNGGGNGGSGGGNPPPSPQ
jgi:hypothetical protein